MPEVRRAVIDIGTNSVKLLVADVTQDTVRPVLEDGRQTRLGRGFYATHELQPGPIAETAQAVAEFARIAREAVAVYTRVIGTSAARDAKNSADLISAVTNASGLPLEIISGEQEAEWAFRGATSDPKLAHESLLLLDVGGGSTEFILGQGARKHFQRSYPVGAVRLLETIPHDDPPTIEQLIRSREWLRKILETTVRSELGPALENELKVHKQHHAVKLVGTGGTAAVMARIENGMDTYERERIEATRLPLEKVRAWVEKLWRLQLAQRRVVPGLPPERADIILTGALIYEAVMEVFQFSELHVSTRGLRFAAVMLD